MEFLPLFHSLQGRTVLVVGGGSVALRKARLLHDAGARLRVVALRVHPELPALAADLRQRAYAHTDLDGVALAVAATDQAGLNAAVSAQAQARGIPVNVVDSPTLCSAIFPAIVDRSPLVVAVGSGGHAPVLARLVRAKIETSLSARYGQLAGLARQFRSQVKARLPNVQQRRIFWEDTFQGPVAEALLGGQPDLARQLLEARLAGAAPQVSGEVYWVGAGPGDPDLLTFRALRLMQQADIVLGGPGVPPAIVDLCRRDADRIAPRPPATGAGPCCSQQLADLASPGKRVLLLLAGNAVSQEHDTVRDTLAARGIAFQVVPGVASGPAPPAPE
ncbi:NAD(P)-dependent oxidoreductase [Bordetella petrii]|uniref:precorrin-2 dehydrogenase n=1 Tax=Bordetella petrii (strain ATCC BAA-461 / DSM 12804 / CCUG 43448 / CIP 107267 / Se-1111R) TaxID=340100 RepID=A9I7B5_BORPD|nr:NAD(P)-dependent oxidoreductase [Bordetella petrii]CAP44394.1 siroheme synthase [Includes: Uroporphyrin-III C-methyltransferase; Urogen III methylase Uroporphyrinogen IIImethylase; Precorrin-2 dehydrogenase; Sirohydrochlorin ferrochelatase] [Bordetella petrii]